MHGVRRASQVTKKPLEGAATERDIVHVSNLVKVESETLLSTRAALPEATPHNAID